MRTTLATAGLLLLGIALAVCVLLDDPGAGAPRSPVATGDRIAGSRERSDPPATIKNPILTSPFPSVPDRAGRGSFTLDVTWADTGRPVPHATVYRVNGATARSIRRRNPLEGRSLHALYHRLGSRLRTGQDGRLTLADDGKGMALLVEHDGASLLSGSFAAEQGTIHARLWPDISLNVRLLDADGLPLPGVGVVLVLSQSGSSSSQVPVARTGPDGRCRARLSGALARRIPHDEVAVAANLPVSPPLTRSWDARALPGQEVVLRASPAGRLEFEFLDADGTRASGAFVAELSPSTPLAPARIGQAGQVQVLSHPSVDGHLVVPQLALDRTWTLNVRHEHCAGSLQTRFTGPESPGMTSHVTLRMGEHDALLRLTLVNAEGVRQKNGRFRLWMNSRRFPRQQSVTSDEEGRICIVVPTMVSRGSQVRTLSIQPVEKTGRLDRSRCATLQVTWPCPVGVTDLGTATLVPTPIVAAGRVVDAEGIPIPFARVEARELAPDGKPVASGGDRPGPMLRALTDSQGRFALHGLTRADELVLGASRQGWLAGKDAVRRISPPAKDVALVLQRAGSITGSFVFRHPNEHWSWPLQLQRVDEVPASRQSRTRQSPDWGDGGAFSFTGLAPGTYRLSAGRSATHPLLEVTDIIVEAGRVTRPPELQETDPSLHASRLSVTVVDRAGGPLAGVGVRLLPPQGPATALTDRAGLARLWTPGVPATLRVAARGFRSRTVQAGSLETRISLDAPLTVILGVSKETAFPGRPFSVQLKLDPLQAAQTVRQSWIGVRRDRPTVLKSDALLPGRYGVTWRVQAVLRDAGKRVPVRTPPFALAPPQVVTLEDSVRPQSVVVAFPQAMFRRLVEEARQKDPLPR